MEKNIKVINMDNKIDIIKKLIYELSEYNGIKGYSNRKEFLIKFQYNNMIDPTENFYTIRIFRGLNKLEEIFNLVYECENNLKLKEFIEEFHSSKYLLYSSYKFDNEKEKVSKYNLNLKNDIIVEIDLKDPELYNLINDINNTFSKKDIYIKKTENITEKNIIQKEKMIKIFIIFVNIFKEFNDYNINNKNIYNNNYRFKIANKYYYIKGCFIYDFSIFRGNIYTEPTLNLRASIKDNKFIYEMIFELIHLYKRKDYFLYDMIKKDINYDKYVISLSNNCLLEFEISNDYDKYFYNGIFESDNIKTLRKEL